MQPNHDDDGDEKGFKLNSHVTHLNRSLNCFWKRWRREYLLELQEAHRLRCANHGLQMSQGNIVVVYSDDQPRSCWKIGQVEHIIEGADGHARAARICVSRKGRTKILNRPIQHLYPLEVAALIEVDDTPQREEIQDVTESGSNERSLDIRRSPHQ